MDTLGVLVAVTCGVSAAMTSENISTDIAPSTVPVSAVSASGGRRTEIYVRGMVSTGPVVESVALGSFHVCGINFPNRCF